MRYFLCVLLLLLTGCSSLDLIESEGVNAFAVVITEVKPTVNCSCDGTGKVKSGDGIIDVPCPCNPCKCEKKENVIKGKQIWFFSGPNCPPCKKMEGGVFPKLKKDGWTIVEPGARGNAHIVKITDDKRIKDYKIEAFPTMILFIDGKEVNRSVGYMSEKQIKKFWDSRESAPK